MDAGRTALGVCLAIVALSAIWDIVSRTIPNTLSLGGIVLGITLHAALGYTDDGYHGALRGFGTSLAGLAACGIFPVISFALKEMGGGDVKLFGAIGALCGPILGITAEAWVFFVLITVGFPLRVVLSGAVKSSLKNAYGTVANLFRPLEQQTEIPKTKLPPMIMGPSIFVGLCVAFVRHGVFQ